jgi:hypothetical protein
LHHPVVAEKALECWIEKLNARISSGAGNAKRYGYTFDRTPLDAELDEALGHLHRLNPKSRALQKARRPLRSAPEPESQPAPAGLPVGVPSGSQGKGTEGNILPVGAAAELEDPNKEAWRRAKALLARAGKISPDQSGKLFGKLLRDHGLEGRDLLPSIVKAETLGTEDPQGYLTACAKTLGQSARGAPASSADVQSWSPEVWAQAVANFAADGAWSASMGAEPGKPGCQAPAEILAKHGFGVVLKAVSGGAA